MLHNARSQPVGGEFLIVPQGRPDQSYRGGSPGLNPYCHQASVGGQVHTRRSIGRHLGHVQRLARAKVTARHGATAEERRLNKRDSQVTARGRGCRGRVPGASRQSDERCFASR